MTDLGQSLRSMPEPGLAEVQRQAETLLAGTVQFALAADQRNIALAGICAAGAVALAAAGGGVMAGETAPHLLPMVAGAFAAGVILFVAAMIFVWAGRPIDFFLAGYEPRLLAPSVASRELAMVFGTEDVQRRIEANRLSLERNAARFRVALTTVGLAPVGGVVAALVAAAPF